MHRFYCISKNITRDKINITDLGTTHHIKDVLRLKKYDCVTVFDDKSTEYAAVIEQLFPEKVILKIIKKYKPQSNGGFSLTIACAIPKKSKIDDIIETLTQLGVHRIIPLKTERVVVKLDKNKEMSRFKRWKTIIQSASQQSRRNSLPIIEPVTDIKELFACLNDYDLKLVPTLEGERKTLKDVIASKAQAKNIIVFIGPEGDFSPAEIALAVKAGCIPVSLGKSVLRVATAAIAVASFILFYENKNS